MFDRMFPARFKDVEETDDIRLYINIRLFDTVSDSGLSCKMHNNIKFVLFEKTVHSVLVSNMKENHVTAVSNNANVVTRLNGTSSRNEKAISQSISLSAIYSTLTKKEACKGLLLHCAEEGGSNILPFCENRDLIINYLHFEIGFSDWF